MTQRSKSQKLEIQLTNNDFFKTVIVRWDNDELKKKLRKKPVSVIIFDFDETMISGHSGGIWYFDQDYRFDTDDDIRNLQKLFHIFIHLDCRIFINSRGVVKQTASDGVNYGVYYFLQKNNLLRYVYAIFGDSTNINILLQTEEQQQQQLQRQRLGLRQRELSESDKWVIYKKSINERIINETGVSPNQVFFFDDSEKNLLRSVSLGIHCIQIDHSVETSSWNNVKQILEIGRHFVQKELSKPLVQQKRVRFYDLYQSIQDDRRIIQKIYLLDIPLDNKVTTISIKMILDILQDFDSALVTLQKDKNF